MALTMKEIRLNPALVHNLYSSTGKCNTCDVSLQETVTGKRHIDGAEYCSDCYYEEVGAVVEESAIGTARIRRR